MCYRCLYITFKKPRDKDKSALPIKSFAHLLKSSYMHEAKVAVHINQYWLSIRLPRRLQIHYHMFVNISFMCVQENFGACVQKTLNKYYK